MKKKNGNKMLIKTKQHRSPAMADGNSELFWFHAQVFISFWLFCDKQDKTKANNSSLKRVYSLQLIITVMPLQVSEINWTIHFAAHRKVITTYGFARPPNLSMKWKKLSSSKAQTALFYSCLIQVTNLWLIAVSSVNVSR